MSHMDSMFDELEAVINEILVREPDQVGQFDPHMKDLMLFANVAMGGLTRCQALGILSPEQVERAQAIGKMYANNSIFMKGMGL